MICIRDAFTCMPMWITFASSRASPLGMYPDHCPATDAANMYNYADRILVIPVIRFPLQSYA